MRQVGDQHIMRFEVFAICSFLSLRFELRSRRYGAGFQSGTNCEGNARSKGVFFPSLQGPDKGHKSPLDPYGLQMRVACWLPLRHTIAADEHSIAP